MSGEELREAAALMRERAEAATPGPWHHESNLGHVPASVVHAAPGVLRGQRRDLPITADTLGRDGKHIASWHPAVALAVADLLDEAAEHLEVSADPDDDSGWVCGTAREGFSCSVMESALAVARAYLGRES